MHKLLTVDVSVPVLGETLHLMVPRNIMGGALLHTVEELVQETYKLDARGDLYFAEMGLMLDYQTSLDHLPLQQGLKLILM